MEVVIVANGDLPESPPPELSTADLVIAADGGVAHLERLNRAPDLVVGDLDSAEPDAIAALRRSGTRIERHPADKEASDTALAVAAGLRAGATRLALLGALGGDRIDHALAAALLLADRSLEGVDARIVHGADTVRFLRAGSEMRLEGRPGDFVTLLPIGGDARGVTTHNLRWSLDDADLEMGTTRGLSNEVVDAPASVRLEAGSLFVIEHARGSGGTTS